MKKTMQFLFSIIAILLVSYQSYAGVNSLPVATPSVEKVTMQIKGGSLPIVIIVTDENDKPVVGAEVTAPCTGLPPQLTDATGTATFKITGACNCSKGEAEITSNTCNMEVPITCGTNYATCTGN